MPNETKWSSFMSEEVMFIEIKIQREKGGER